MAYETPITVKKAIDNIRKKHYVLPSIQREFVWDTDQIEKLFDFHFDAIPLNFNPVFNEVEKINSIWQEIKTLTEVEYPIEIIQTQEEIEYQQFDEFLKSSNLEKTKAIKSNLHIFEAINILNDLTQ